MYSSPAPPSQNHTLKAATTTSTISIEPVTSPIEIPALATVFEQALGASDTFFLVIERYGERSALQDTTDKLLNALKVSEECVFKAVEVVRDVESGEVLGREVVGVSQWFVGYIQLPKVDPFEKPEMGVAPTANDHGEKRQEQEEVEAGEVEEGLAPLALPVSGGATSDGSVALKTGEAAQAQVIAKHETESKFNFYDRLVRPMRNAYISAIRGKRHVYLRRMGVLPSHQRKGIATKLLQWGLDRADEGKMVSYLNARPAGRPLYERAGWRGIVEVDCNVPGMGIAVEPMVAMIRQPRITGPEIRGG